MDHNINSALDDGFDEALKVDDDIIECNDNADYTGLSLALSALAKENLQKLSPFFADGEYDGDEDGNGDADDSVDNW